MQNVTAVISMIHEPAVPSSASRFFRQQPVLEWTLQRLRMSQSLQSLAVICWEDQLEQVTPIAAEYDAHILAKGPRIPIPAIQAVAAARRWSDGWRSGPLFTCDFDLGFHGPWVKQVIEKLGSDAVVLVDPSSGLVDAGIIDRIIEHARERENAEIVFTQAAPGLAGVLLRPSLIERLASANTHPGRLLHYLPDQPMRDPIGGDSCLPVPASITRTTRNFRLDSDRQITRLTDAAVNLNGELASSDAEDLLNRMVWTADVEPVPREIVLELNTARRTCPIFWPGRAAGIDRAPMSVELASRLFDQIAAEAEDVRLTLGGVGDPLLHEKVFDIIAAARSAGVHAIHLETDLLPRRSEFAARLADSLIDIVSVHLPAMTRQTYLTVMGIDGFGEALENIRRFITRRHELGRGVPILVPLFAKCHANLAEMENWYDQWLKALGTAVINGPSDFAGLIPDRGLADMSPPRRQKCNRLWSRMTILCDGRVVSCEQDVLGRQVVGDIASQPLPQIWREGFGPLREAHKTGCWNAGPVCAACREWHRP